MNKPLTRVLTGFFLTLVLDGISKYWVHTTLLPFQPQPILGSFFRLTLGYNSGMAFSMFDESGKLPAILVGIIILGGGVWVAKALRRGEISAMAAWPIGFIAGGAVGNFIDRLPDGHVTDFLDFGLGTWRFATFNLADTAIVLGTLSLALLMLLDGEPTPAAEIPTSEIEKPMQ